MDNSYQGPVVQRGNSIIQQINPYPADKIYTVYNSYPVDNFIQPSYNKALLEINNCIVMLQCKNCTYSTVNTFFVFHVQTSENQRYTGHWLSSKVFVDSVSCVHDVSPRCDTILDVTSSLKRRTIYLGHPLCKMLDSPLLTSMVYGVLTGVQIRWASCKSKLALTCI